MMNDIVSTAFASTISLSLAQAGYLSSVQDSERARPSLPAAPATVYASQGNDAAWSAFEQATYTRSAGMSNSDVVLLHFSPLVAAIAASFFPAVIAAEVSHDHDTGEEETILYVRPTSDDIALNIQNQTRFFEYVSTQPALERMLTLVTVALI